MGGLMAVSPADFYDLIYQSPSLIDWVLTDDWI